MRPDSRLKPDVDGPGPVRLADDVDRQPEDPRPEANRGPTLPAGFDHQPEAPAVPDPKWVSLAVEPCPPASSRCFTSMTWLNSAPAPAGCWNACDSPAKSPSRTATSAAARGGSPPRFDVGSTGEAAHDDR